MVLWPSGYGVTFRFRPIRDGKPREFESRQCQFFFSLSLIFVDGYPQLCHNSAMCYIASLSAS
jgi:hypothetical protein